MPQMMQSLTKSKYDNITFHIPTPDGTANIIILEERPGKIVKIFMMVGKAGSSINAYCYALAEMTVHSLCNGSDIHEVIALLGSITSDRTARIGGGAVCRSGPEALQMALMKYRNTCQADDSDTKFRAARFTNPRRA